MCLISLWFNYQQEEGVHHQWQRVIHQQGEGAEGAKGNELT